MTLLENRQADPRSPGPPALRRLAQLETAIRASDRASAVRLEPAPVALPLITL